jgi:hypothetical protein
MKKRSDNLDDLWIGDEDDLLAAPSSTPRRGSANHIGCPVAWLKRVLPVVNTKEQLAVAIWLHRRRAVCGKTTFTVPNRALFEELGLTRSAKYHTLSHLERAGVIVVAHDSKRTLRVRLLW